MFINKVPERVYLLEKIKNITPDIFDQTAVEVCHYQYFNNPVYKQYADLLGVKINADMSAVDIPYLPISLFKNHTVKTGEWPSVKIFESSGTTGQLTSKHHVRDLSWYESISSSLFEDRFGTINNYSMLALLPSYLERDHSSLVQMVRFFMDKSGSPLNGWYLYDHDKLAIHINKCISENKPCILWGVTFALLDFCSDYRFTDCRNIYVIETGGMKGKGKELTREEAHALIQNAMPGARIFSEYGMTELLSQAYTVAGKSTFVPGKTFKMDTVEINDPLQRAGYGKTGVIRVTDLANLDSCAFICTEDIGKTNQDGTFEVIGRLDQSELRGCNLMIQ